VRLIAHFEVRRAWQPLSVRSEGRFHRQGYTRGGRPHPPSRNRCAGTTCYLISRNLGGQAAPAQQLFAGVHDPHVAQVPRGPRLCRRKRRDTDRVASRRRRTTAPARHSAATRNASPTCRASRETRSARAPAAPEERREITRRDLSTFNHSRVGSGRGVERLSILQVSQHPLNLGFSASFNLSVLNLSIL